MTRGSLYGDFSSFRPDPPPGSDLLQQQGRVQLDADWNQQVTAASERLAGALGDILGGGVAPLLDPGFHVRPVVALGFDGDGAAVAPDPARHRDEPVRDLTIEMWVRWFGVEGSVLATEGGGEGGHGGWSLRVASDGRPALSRSFHRGGRAHWTEVAAREAVPVGVFVRLVVVVRGSWVRFLIGSEEAGTDTFPDLAPSEVVEGKVLIGAGAGPHRRPPLVGEVAGVRLWAEARSHEDLRLGAEPASPDAADAPPALLAWWPMDDGAGSSARDVVSSDRAVFAGRVRPRWRLVDLDIAPGRYYVDGVAVGLPAGVRFSAQPTAPHQPVPGAVGHHLVYLETWLRTVLPVQDPALREVALGGADTTVRQETVAAVRSCRLDPDGRGPDPRGRVGTTGALRARSRGRGAGNALYRIEVVASGAVEDSGAVAPSPAVLVLGLDARSGLLHVSGAAAVHLGPGDPVVLEAGGGALWCGATVLLRSSGWIVVDAAPSALEELEAVGRLTVRRLAERPTFAWSRTNGSAVLAVAAVQPGCRVIDVVPSPADDVQVGDLVELVDDQVVFSDRPQPIRRVIDRSAHTVTLDQPVPVGIGVSAATHPFLRRWDHGPGDEELIDGAVPIVVGRWSSLEHGIEVEFAPGSYQRGDYWWVVARDALDGIDWPVVDGHPARLRPTGVDRRRVPIASVTIDDERGIVVRDLRTTLVPLSATGLVTSGDRSRRSAPVTRATAAVAPIGDRPVGVEEHRPGDADPSPPAPEDGPDEPRAPAPRPPVPIEPGGAPDPVPDRSVARVARAAWARQPLDTEGLGQVTGVVGVGTELLVVTERGVVAVDPATGEWELVGPAPADRIEHSCGLVDGAVLLVGGREPGGRRDGTVHAFDVASRSWSHRAPLPTPVSWPCVAASDGTLHVLGGMASVLRRASRVVRHHQVYDAATDAWRTGPELPRPVARAAGGVLDDGVHVVGGVGRWSFGRRPEDRHDVWTGGRWRRAEPLRHPRAHLDAAVVDGLLAVVGSGADTASVVVTFAPRADRWEVLVPLPGPAAAPLVTGDASGLVVVGRSEEGVSVDRIASPPAGRW